MSLNKSFTQKNIAIILTVVSIILGGIYFLGMSRHIMNETNTNLVVLLPENPTSTPIPRRLEPTTIISESSEPIDRSSLPSAIQALCNKGPVSIHEDIETSQIMYGQSSKPDYTGTITYYNEEGGIIGTAQWSDVQEFKLDDDSLDFCIFDGRKCPRYVEEVCK